jgi:hypothetical protein
MTNLQEYTSITPESMLLSIKESLLQSGAEFDRKLAESRANFEEEMKQSREEFNKRMKKLEEQAGAWGNNFGRFAEEYFFNSFESGKQDFFGEKFDSIEKNVKDFDYKIKDEYDILLVNGHSVGIVEIKFKAHENDIPKVINKSKTFRINFPEYKKHKVYIALATMAFYPKLEEECLKQGIAMIKQAGDNVIVYDKHLKVY